MTENTLDPRTYVRQRIADTKPSSDWETVVSTKTDLTTWQTELRATVLRLLGDLTRWERPPLAPEMLSTVVGEGYVCEKVRLTTRPGLFAVGYFLRPEQGTGTPRPTVLCLPGHGPGASTNVGLTPVDYAAHFPVQCVRRGYNAFVLEQFSFGDRRDEKAQAAGGGVSSCARDSAAALLLGECMVGWRVWDAMRALDYLETRPEVDTSRLAVMGISGGGTTSLFTAALDTRVSACALSGYFNTFADSILAIDHCIDNYVPGLLTVCEMPDLAGLIAPRALVCENGTVDPIFPVAAFEKACAKARSIYAAFGVPDRFASATFEGDHRFEGAVFWPLLAHAFKV